MTKNNIVMITMDQLSLHALSCYDSYLSKTPALDALAQDSITFTKCYTPCALCTPARASILTGLYPHNHGALHNSGIMLPFSEQEIGQRVTTFSNRLQKSNYYLGYQGKWHTGLSKTANDMGFTGFGPEGYGHYKESTNYTRYLQEHNIKPVDEIIEFYAQHECNWLDSSGYEVGDIKATGSYFLVEETKTLINEFLHKENSFFHWLSFWGPHAPYWPHESYLNYYIPEQIEQWKSFHENYQTKPYIHQKYREFIMPKAAHADWDQWSQIICRYYSYTRMIDDQIGRLISYLKDINEYDSMTIIFTADHGDSLGIHNGVFDKGPMAYEQIYHIPLIIKLPNQVNSSQKHNGFVSLLDLAPTICDIANTSMPEVDGSSLLPLLCNPAQQGKEEFMAEFHGHRFPVGQRILWWKDYKFILNFGDKDELYQVSVDKEEMCNLINEPEYIEIANQMRNRLMKQLKNSKDRLHDQTYRVLTQPYNM